MLENKRDFYKFWLGFVEKIIIVLLVSILVPLFIGQVEISFLATFIWGVIFFVLIIATVIVSLKLWKLK